MDAGAVIEPTMRSLSRKRALLRSIPAFFALLTIAAINYLVSPRFSLGPHGLTPGLIVLLVLALAIAIRSGQARISRSVRMILLGVVTAAEAISTGALIAGLVSAPAPMSDVPHATALVLLRDGALLRFGLLGRANPAGAAGAARRPGRDWR